jgi:hypothetical protein
VSTLAPVGTSEHAVIGDEPDRSSSNADTGDASAARARSLAANGDLRLCPSPIVAQFGLPGRIAGVNEWFEHSVAAE